MKKIVSIMLLVMMVLSLVGCGSKESSEGNGQEVKVIKIGGSGPISEVAKVYGTAVKNAMELAIEEIMLRVVFNLNQTFKMTTIILN